MSMKSGAPVAESAFFADCFHEYDEAATAPATATALTANTDIGTSACSGVLGWHFLPADRRLRQVTALRMDGSEFVAAHAGILIEPGKTISVPGPPIPARWGLHAALRPAEAVFHAPGLIVCRVALSGQIVYDPSGRHVCATRRTVLWMADATVVVWAWLVWGAMQSLERLKPENRGAVPAHLSHLGAAVIARKKWLRYLAEGCPDHPEALAALDAARGPARRVYRQIHGLTTDGKQPGPKSPLARSAGTPAAKEAASRCLNLVTSRVGSFRDAAGRCHGFYQTGHGERENTMLEKCLERLERLEHSEHMGHSEHLGEQEGMRKR